MSSSTHKRRHSNGLCIKCGLKPHRQDRKMCADCADVHNEMVIACNIKLRVAAFNAYGGVKCACCGVDKFTMLTLDHINGGGEKHRIELGVRGKDRAGSNNRVLYTWLKKNDYPPGFQVLCWNCNLSKHNNGVCEHKIEYVHSRALRELQNESI